MPVADSLCRPGRPRSSGALASRGVASLAVVRHWRLVLAECTAAIDCLAEHERYDPARLAIVGYSLGGYLAIATTARDKRVRAVVLAAAGDLPLGTPFERLIRTVADPLKAVRRLSGRPVLMTHGRYDRTEDAAAWLATQPRAPMVAQVTASKHA